MRAATTGNQRLTDEAEVETIGVGAETTAYDATVAAYRQTVLTGFQEVEDNLATLRILEAEAQALEQAVISSRESLAVTMNQYRAGIVSYLNVIVSQRAALANESSAADLLGRRLVTSVLLIEGLGGSWDASLLGGDSGRDRVQ